MIIYVNMDSKVIFAGRSTMHCIPGVTGLWTSTRKGGQANVDACGRGEGGGLKPMWTSTLGQTVARNHVSFPCKSQRFRPDFVFTLAFCIIVRLKLTI